MDKDNRFIPSNGTEGRIFTECFCTHCIHEKFMNSRMEGDKKCEIYNNAILHSRPCYNKDLGFDGWEWFSKEFDDWECRQYKHWNWGDDLNGWHNPPAPVDPNQLLLFTFDENLDGLLRGKKLYQEVKC